MNVKMRFSTPMRWKRRRRRSTGRPPDNAILDSDTQTSSHMANMIRLFSRRKLDDDEDAPKGRGGRRPQFFDASAVAEYFGYAQSDAARQLGISVTTLKKVCRQFGILRWPGPSRAGRRLKPKSRDTAVFSPTHPSTHSTQETRKKDQQPSVRKSPSMVSDLDRLPELLLLQPRSMWGAQSASDGSSTESDCVAGTLPSSLHNDSPDPSGFKDDHAGSCASCDSIGDDLGWLMTIYGDSST